jgi:hypothetical protein
VVVLLNYFHIKDAQRDASAQKSEEEHGPEHLDIVGSFLLDYVPRPEDQAELLRKPVEVAAQDVRAFAEFNATFNAWPFWREFVQSMTARMGLPAVVVPLLPVPNLTKSK